MKKLIDILVINTSLSRGTAAYRRISYFVSFLARNNMNLICIGFKLITNSGVRKPINECLTYIVPLISSASLWTKVVNIMLSFPLLLFIIFLKPKIILISVPDYSVLIPSYIGAKIINAKLVIDMRDPPEISFYTILTRARQRGVMTKLISFLSVNLSNLYYYISRRAHLITVVTNGLKMRLEKKSLRNVVVVPNGADLKLFRRINKTIARSSLGIDSDVFLVAYAGLIGAYHDLANFLVFMKKLNMTSNRRIKLVMAGPVVDEKHQLLIRSPTLKDLVIYLGRLDTKRLIEVLSASDIGIVPLTTSPIFDYAVPVKFYEYIALGLPVLALCNDNIELCRLVRENRLGFSCRPEDLACIKHSLSNLMSEDIYLKIKANVEEYRSKVDRIVGARTLLIVLRRMLNMGEGI